MIKCDMKTLEVSGNSMIVQAELSVIIQNLLRHSDSDLEKEMIFQSCIAPFVHEELLTDEKMDFSKAKKRIEFINKTFEKVQKFNKKLDEEDVKEDDGDFRQVGTFIVHN